jgi:regulator of protease activity HflC (stomatin/prohibitin superfamily)
VQNYTYAVSQVAQTSLRSVIGQSDMDELLSERDKVNARLKDVIDEPTEQPWGIRVERVEVKDVSLPESMKRSMSRQAEAERERLLQTVVEVAGEKNSTLVMPVPVELLRFFDRAAPAGRPRRSAAAGIGAADGEPPAVEAPAVA